MIEENARILAVPFPPEAELVTWDLASKGSPAGLADSLPCVFVDAETEELLLTTRHIPLFLRQDLDLSRLNDAYPYLWWAGRQNPARSLQRQVSNLAWGRTVCPAERADLHLVWCSTSARLFLKPLPAYLLSHWFWTTYLQDKDLAASARGLLLSYIWILRSETDWRIAQQSQLLPLGVTWSQWRTLVEAMLDIHNPGRMDTKSLSGVHRRFHYGALRLNRLDHILRFMPPLRVGNLLWGYGVRHPTYSDFFQRRFRWIILAFAFCTTVLSALQVALATDILSTSSAVHKLSYAVTVLCLVTVAVIILVVTLLYVALFFFNVTHTVRHKIRQEQRRAASATEFG